MIKKIFFVFWPLLILGGCTSYNVINDYRLPDGLTLRLLSGNIDISDSSINFNTTFSIYIPPEQQKNPNPFSPSMALGLAAEDNDFIKIELLNNNKKWVATAFEGMLPKGYYSLVALKGDYKSASYLFKITKNSKETLYVGHIGNN